MPLEGVTSEEVDQVRTYVRAGISGSNNSRGFVFSILHRGRGEGGGKWGEDGVNMFERRSIKKG